MSATVATVPRRELSLSASDVEVLRRWEQRLAEIDETRDQLRQDFAAWVRAIGPAAVARELGISRGAMDQRLRTLEGKRRKA